MHTHSLLLMSSDWPGNPSRSHLERQEDTWASSCRIQLYFGPLCALYSTERPQQGRRLRPARGTARPLLSSTRRREGALLEVTAPRAGRPLSLVWAGSPRICASQPLKMGAPQASGAGLWQHMTGASQNSRKDGNGDGEAKDEILMFTTSQL